jgi:hypothetical protein
LVLRHVFWPKPIPGVPHNPVTSFWGDMLVMGQVEKETAATVQKFFEPNARKLGAIYQVWIALQPKAPTLIRSL